MDLDLSGKVALVAGGSKGSGWPAPSCSQREGCRVAITERDKANLDSAAKRIGSCFVHTADLTSADAAARMIETVERETGGIDILVNSAGAAHAAGRSAIPPLGMQPWMRSSSPTFMR